MIWISHVIFACIPLILPTPSLRAFLRNWSKENLLGKNWAPTTYLPNLGWSPLLRSCPDIITTDTIGVNCNQRIWIWLQWRVTRSTHTTYHNITHSKIIPYLNTHTLSSYNSFWDNTQSLNELYYSCILQSINYNTKLQNQGIFGGRKPGYL